MRDYLLTVVIFGALPFVFRRPWLGVLLWTWIGMMNPHRLAFSFAYTMPFAAIVGIVTMVAFLFSQEPKRYPFTPVTVTLIIFVIWMNVSAAFALPNGDYLWTQWDKVMKVQLFIAITLIVMNSEERIRMLTWVATMSIAFFGIKGGFFTLTHGGNSMVLGPEGSFIEGNTEVALAITVAVPMIRYLQMQAAKQWVRWALGIGMALCAIAAIGSYSRGGLLAVAAMGIFLWLKSRSKLMVGTTIALLIPPVLAFMPVEWFDKMNTISNYQQDGSAMGRINAWNFALNLSKDRWLTGGGFGTFNDENFAIWAPEPTNVHDAHSIWFQVLGEHGYIGLALFLLLWLLAWRLANSIIRSCKGRDDLRWAADLAAMIQVSLIGYWVGGSFLGLAYWDMPYVLLSILVLSGRVVEARLAPSAVTIPEHPSVETRNPQQAKNGQG